MIPGRFKITKLEISNHKIKALNLKWVEQEQELQI